MLSGECNAWFASAPASQVKQLKALRTLITSLDRGVVEEFKWSRPCYSTERGLFCYLHSTKAYATLGFHRGASLTDPAALLEGTGKDMRHVKIAADADVNGPALLALLRQAAGQ